MTSSEITSYIKSREGELSSDEILCVLDIERNPQINYIEYKNGIWEMWDDKGIYFTFAKRK